MDSDADKTRMIRRNRPDAEQGAVRPDVQNQDPDATRIIQGGNDVPATPPNIPDAVAVPDDDPTRLLNQPSAARPADAVPAGDVDSDKTQLMRRKKTPAAPASAAPTSCIDDPVTGWLVVIDGPGKGSQVAVGEQDNRVGRGGGDESPRVTLDFGDAGISRTNAFILRYDPKKRRFKLLPGEGSNIVYVNGEDLDGPTELKDGDVIELSNTKLRFAPFCGEGFDWEDTE